MVNDILKELWTVLKELWADLWRPRKGKDRDGGDYA